MSGKTPKKKMQKRSLDSPKSPGWISGKDAVFLTPASTSPKAPRTRRTSVYQKMKQASPDFKIPITQLVSPKGVQTRSRRSSMFGVYKKGGVRLNIAVTPNAKKVSPPTTGNRRTSVYQKDNVKETSTRTTRRTSMYQKPQEVPVSKGPTRRTSLHHKPQDVPKANNRRASVYKSLQDIPKPPTRRTRKLNTDKAQTVIKSPVISLVDIISPNKAKSDSVLLTPSQGKTNIEKSLSDPVQVNFKTPTHAENAPESTSKGRRSTRKTSTKKSPKQPVGKTPRTSQKEVPKEAEESSMLITFKTPAVSVRKSARKRKAEDKISPPSKKCILDLSPVEKISFKTPHQLDKSPILLLDRTPLTDVFTSTPRELGIKPMKTPLNPLLLTGKKSLKTSRSSVKRLKKVSIISDLKSPDSNRKSLTTRRRGTPAKSKINNENLEETEIYTQKDDVVSNLSILRDSKVFIEPILSDSKVYPEPANVTIVSENNDTTRKSLNTTSHSSHGRCTIL